MAFDRQSWSATLPRWNPPAPRGPQRVAPVLRLVLALAGLPLAALALACAAPQAQLVPCATDELFEMEGLSYRTTDAGMVRCHPDGGRPLPSPLGDFPHAE